MRRRSRPENPAAVYQQQSQEAGASAVYYQQPGPVFPELERYKAAARGYWKQSRSRLIAIWILTGLLVTMVATAGAMVATGRIKLNSEVKSEPKVNAFELKKIGVLATQAGYFTMVQNVKLTREADLTVVKFTVPFSEANYVFSYDGVVRAGLNFSDIDLQTDEKNKTITIHLPETYIISTTLDEKSFQQYTGGGNLLSQLRPEEIANGQAEVIKKAERTAIENGILGEARENAKVLIEEFLSGGYDLGEYAIVYQ